MSLFPAYLKERLGWETIEHDEGFVCYSFAAPFCRIEEIYVVPKRRGKGYGSEMVKEVEKIARAAGYGHLWTQVLSRSLTSTDTLAKALSYGFKVTETANGAIIMTKEIGG